MTPPRRALTMGTGIVEATDPPQRFAFDDAPRWSVLVLSDGTPAQRVELPSPRGGGPRLVAAALARHGDPVAFRRALRADLRARLGAPRDDVPPTTPRVSVVLCTHRRPQYIRDVLGGLSRLDPAPHEVIVVDNDPGDQDCEAFVREAGFRYVREDRRGLDNARNTGVRNATGDVVAFTDDDCVPWPAWLRSVPTVFADPLVGAMSGPAFPWKLDTPSRVRMERTAPLSRGVNRITYTWHTISINHAGGVGFGANMAFRREVLLELGPEPFPPELDAGTPSESGGDYYVFARTIVNGHRVVYEPDFFTFHQHRPDPRALHRAIRGYGTGCASAIAKLATEHRELETWRAWWWLVAQHLRTQRRRVVGRADTVETRLSWEFIIGWALGWRRWRTSLAQQRAIAATLAPPPEPPAAPAPAEGAPAPEGAPAISIVIPTHHRPDAIARCLDHLARQSVDAPFEVLVIDDAGPAILTLDEVQRPGLTVRLIATGGRGASEARNLGAAEASAPLVLFVDDDMLAAPELVSRHLAAHANATTTTAVVGAYPPAPPFPSLAARSTAIWWSDTFELLRGSTAHTFMSMLSGNLSVPRDAFLAMGGFSQVIPYRREDWELGVRWTAAGHAIAYEPNAIAIHEYGLTTPARLRGAELEGFGDAKLAQLYPETLGTLPVVAHTPPSQGGRLRAVGFAAWRLAPVKAAVHRALDLLEAGKLREAWLRLMKLAQRAAYHDGLVRAQWDGPAQAEHVLDVDLLDDAPLPRPGIAAPTLRLTLGDREVGWVRPSEGMWGPHVADQVIEALDERDIERLAQGRGWAPAPAAPSPLRADITLVPFTTWAEVADAVAAADTPLVAITLAPTTSDADAAAPDAWLDEALDAFDETAVDVAFGSGLAADLPVRPLHLHDAAAPPTFAAGDAPAYLVLRVQRVLQLGGIPVELAPHGAPAPALALIGAVLQAGGLVARRDVHGLGDPAVPPREQGAAWAAATLASHTKNGGPPPATLARGAVGLAATVLWRTYKDRGRPDPALIGAARGAAETGLQAASPMVQRRARGT
ncbi:glycosyltransferase [Baekduia sp. Peel2402]|uniref:glycosyltransferase n=1 Tax=Baekduia sp. Peel2402 TaxID=3458296 RepID=UPI00403EAD8D